MVYAPFDSLGCSIPFGTYGEGLHRLGRQFEAHNPAHEPDSEHGLLGKYPQAPSSASTRSLQWSLSRVLPGLPAVFTSGQATQASLDALYMTVDRSSGLEFGRRSWVDESVPPFWLVFFKTSPVFLVGCTLSFVAPRLTTPSSGA